MAVARDDFIVRYVALAPLALAIERTQECRILASHPFETPILDLGCGDGIFAKVLFDRTIDTGIDSDPAEIRMSQRQGAHRELIACHAHAVPKPAGTYRTILSNSVLEHIPDLLPVLSEVRRLLAPGGRFYATLPTQGFERASVGARCLAGLGFDTAAARYRAAYNRFWKHHNVHDEVGWRRLFEAAGFRVLEAITYGPRFLCTVCDALVPLAVPSFVCRRLTGRWVLLPHLRRFYVAPLARLASALIARGEREAGEGLIFLA
ncbi:MAG: hypothetical protein A3J29_16875, partial [Acidobacteria bacterium RIFCSPLOWO2_12_FULL_67_14b]